MPASTVLTTSVPLFFGGRGWTFRQAGPHKITARFIDPLRRAAVEAEPLSVALGEADAAGRRLLQAGDAGREAGKFLTWLGGDHLRKGISELKDLVADYPDSPLADHARLALGVNLSRDSLSFSLGKVRRAECWSALHFLEPIVAERLPALLRIRRDLAHARCLLRASASEQARALVARAAATADSRDDLRRLVDGLAALHQLPR